MQVMCIVSCRCICLSLNYELIMISIGIPQPSVLVFLLFITSVFHLIIRIYMFSPRHGTLPLNIISKMLDESSQCLAAIPQAYIGR